MTSDTSDTLDLGPCCACGALTGVRNLVALPWRAPVAGTGWGCFVCGLPNDGAVAVVCDSCIAGQRDPVRACLGYPVDWGRVDMKDLTESFDHRLELHPEMNRPGYHPMES